MDRRRTRTSRISRGSEPSAAPGRLRCCRGRVAVAAGPVTSAVGRLGIAAVEIDGRLPHLDHLHDAVLRGALHGGRHIGGPRDALGALAAEGWALAGSSALHSESEFLRHLRAQGLLQGNQKTKIQ
ncbi:hypothetical protein CDAR_173101 [Caerostris darwini]|uniref:Uncharacterized protein n=1 Tax=Caerostris darwini TaxID=1538125 RepID=A0AAV4WJL2_9ARAC|nr:hypothetical protein CDAR_173101 [Caerostris darwini]